MEKKGYTTFCCDIAISQNTINQRLAIYYSDIFTFKRDFR